MSVAPTLNVLLVTYNHEPYIDSALASIAAQVTEFDVEVVVADDMSTDATLGRISAWAEDMPFPVRILPSERRLGITLNYYRGLSACQGDFVAVLEGDDEWISVDKLQAQAVALRDTPDAPMVANRVLLFDDSNASSTVIPLIGHSALSTRVSARQLASENYFATFSCCMYRTETLRHLPVELFETTAFDWLLNMALTEHGDAIFLPEVMTLYRTHGGGQWSSMSQAHRENQIRELIPKYVELVGPVVGAELTRQRHRFEQILRSRSWDDTAVDQHDQVEPLITTQPAIPRVGAHRPRVSVVMTCYNHSRWVMEAINSVLDQSMSDLELVIVDDASADDSVRQIARISDPRMRVYQLGSNLGAAAALNIAIQQTRSDLVAVINSDDAWEPTKLQRQVEVLELRPELGAVFTGARFVGEEGEPIAPSKIPVWNDVFRQPARSQAQWLRYFFENGNALCHPSVLIRREFYERHGLYDNRLRQIPDLERWIALVKHYPIAVLGDEDLVRFRLLSAEQNASSASPANVARNMHEHLAIHETFFEGCSDELLIEAFIDALVDPLIRTPAERECEIAFLWWNIAAPMQGLNRVEALRRFRLLLGNDETALLLRTRYGVTDLSFHQMSAHEAYVRVSDLVQEVWNDSVSRSPTSALLATIARRVRGVHPTRWPKRAVYHLGALRSRPR